jgi:polyisoprenyl-teichoic acid--peptidoglycan teichoic acid transferase
MLVDDGRPSLLKRFALGALLVVFAAASATAVAAFREVDRVVNAFKVQPELKLGTDLATTDPGKPQTIMLLGSDRRPKGSGDRLAGGARSDTIMLIRLDPHKDATAIMSLPRDLKVQIPGHGTDKLNAAYEIGGPRLTLRTVKKLTGLQVNHVINVDFRGFWAGVNALHCVYADVDRRYYNASAAYAYINLQPGYQRMCGRQALQYVRYRHEDTDLVRSARQQDFLRQAKQQVGVGKLIKDRDRLLKIFGHYTSSDIRSRKEVLRIIKLAVASVGQPIREVHFEGSITSGNEATNTPSYVVAGSRTVRKLTKQFLGVQETRGPRGTLGPRRRHRRSGGGDLGLENAAVAGKAQGVQAVQQGAGGRLPVLYPTLRTTGSLFAGPPRVYKIRSLGGTAYGSYRMVIKRGRLGEYYGLQATRWMHPPILDNPTETRKIGRRSYELHFDGDRLRLVAWRTSRAVYWISNTLLQSLSERQMLAIARSTRAL